MEIKSAPVHKPSWDEASQKAEERLKKEGIQIPWHYNDTFGDDFKVLALRAGGFGVVFFVKSTRFGERIYAAKTLQRFLKEDYLKLSTYEQERIAKDFLEEALPWLEMGQHPNIVSVHLLKNIVHPTTRRNVPFVFSEFMEKGDLRRLVIEKGKLSLEETFGVGLHICEGLLHAYKHGISAHKDLKPENIMVYKDGIYKVTDFSAGIRGTPGYMAPEQEAGAKIDHRADQFAIGLIMHDVFKGGDPLNEQIKRAGYIRSDPRKEVLSENILSFLKGIIARCLQSRIEDRFYDISELKKELLKAYKGEFNKEYHFPEVEKDDSPEWWFNRGRAFCNIGRNADAEMPFKEALRRLEVIHGTEEEQANCFMNLGIVSRSIGKFYEAEAHHKEALRMYKAIPGTEKEQATCLTNLGAVYYNEGKFYEAENSIKGALRILKLVPEAVIEQAKCLGGLGNVYNGTGRFYEAEANYRGALKMFKMIDGREKEQAGCLISLGTVYYSTSQFYEAESSFKEALGMLRSTIACGPEEEHATCLMDIGCVYGTTGKFYEAESSFKEALEMFKALHMEIGQAKCLMSLGNVYMGTGRFSEAEANYNEAMKVFKAIPETEISQAQCLMNMGILYIQIQEFSKARNALKGALEICERYPLGTAQIKNACLKLLNQLL